MRVSIAVMGIGVNVLMQWSGPAGSVCCVAWKDDQQFATASAGHHIQFTSGEPGGRETWRGDAPDITHLTWSPDGNNQSLGSD